MRPLLALALLLAPAHAHAFDTYARYDESTLLGGGGGRYFTGSVQDGFTCAVCHTGGLVPDDADVEASIPELFVDGYQPGQTYEIRVTLPNTNASAVALEVVDLIGAGAGTLTLIPDAMQGDPDRCDREPMMEPVAAAHLVDLAAGSRQVAVVDVCGADQLRVNWTAPDASTGPVWLNAGIVGADRGGTPLGDGVFVYARVIPSVGDVEVPRRVTSTCEAAPTGPSGSAWLVVIVAMLALRARSEARARRA